MSFEKRLILKPLTIGILMIMYTSVLLFSEMLVYWGMLLFSFFLLFLVNPKKAFSFVLVYIFLFTGIKILSKIFIIDGWLGSIYTMGLIVIKLFPLWSLAGIATNFNISEIIASLRKTKLPNNLCIGVSIFIRFIPEYKRYLNEIKEGLKVRNISFNILQPIHSIEMYLVPMIYKAFETGNVLTCALITKGIEFDCKKTSYADLSLTWCDYAAMIVGVGFIGIAIWEKLQK